MKIGILVHSLTGNTYSVSQILKQKLILVGHSVSVERIETDAIENTKEKNVTKIKLKAIPNINSYDALILAAPVRSFSISPMLETYLSQVTSMENKKVGCLVTQFFPFPQMGGTRAISQIRKICESKGAIISCTGIVNWMIPQRAKKILNVVDDMSSMF